MKSLHVKDCNRMNHSRRVMPSPLSATVDVNQLLIQIEFSLSPVSCLPNCVALSADGINCNLYFFIYFFLSLD